MSNDKTKEVEVAEISDETVENPGPRPISEWLSSEQDKTPIETEMSDLRKEIAALRSVVEELTVSIKQAIRRR